MVGHLESVNAVLYGDRHSVFAGAFAGKPAEL
jgi:hypothetical protein